MKLELKSGKALSPEEEKELVIKTIEFLTENTIDTLTYEKVKW